MSCVCMPTASRLLMYVQVLGLVGHGITEQWPGCWPVCLMPAMHMDLDSNSKLGLLPHKARMAPQKRKHQCVCCRARQRST